MRSATLLLFLLLIVFPGRVVAQRWQWAQSNSGANVRDVKITADPWGGIFSLATVWGDSVFILGGDTVRNLDTLGHHCILSRYDSRGRVRWQRPILNSNTTVLDAATDKFGNLLVLGALFTDTLSLGYFSLSSQHGHYSYFLAKYDSSGNVLWCINPAGEASPGYDRTEVTNTGKIAVDAGGNIFLGIEFQAATVTIGAHKYVNADSSANSSDIILRKFDITGNEVWTSKFGGPGYEGISDMTVSSRGDLYLTGIMASSTVHAGAAVISNTSENPVSFLVRFDGNGKPAWGQRFGGFLDLIMGLAPDTAGNIYVTGFMSGKSVATAGVVISNPTPGQEVQFVLKLNSGNRSDWCKIISSRPRPADVDDEDKGVWGWSVAVSRQGAVWVNGSMMDSVFIDREVLRLPPGSIHHLGETDAVFVAGFSGEGRFADASAIRLLGRQIVCAANSNVIICGLYNPALRDVPADFYRIGADLLGHNAADSRHSSFMFVAEYAPAGQNR